MTTIPRRIHTAVWAAVALLACSEEPGGTTHLAHTDVPTTGAPTTGTAGTGTDVIGFITSADPEFPLYQHLEVTLSEDDTVAVVCVDDADPDDRHVRLGDVPATVHAFELYGLRADRGYTCTATAAGAAGDATFATGPLPDDELPNLDLTVERPSGETYGGYVLYSNFPLAKASSEAVVIVDVDGGIRWFYRVVGDATLANLDVSYLGDDTLLLGGGGSTQATGTGNGLPPILLGLDGVERWRAPRSDTGQPHHHAGEIPGGDIVWLDNVDMVDGANSWLGFIVRRMTPYAADLAFDWSSQTAFDRGQLPRGFVDPYHANSVTWVEDVDGPAYWVSLKNASEIIRIDETTGDVTWRLGYGGDFTLFDEQGVEVTDPTEWFSGQHDPELNGDTLLIHDNRDASPDQLTRALQLRLDIPNRTATIVWQWRQDDWHENLFGDADLLPNGHVQLTQGRSTGSDTSIQPSRIVEVDPATGLEVWRLSLGEGISVYQSQRIDGCAVFHNARYCDTLE